MHLSFDQMSFDDAEATANSTANVAADGPDLDLAFDNDFAEVQRHGLDEHSWIGVIPRLIHSPERLFTNLLNSLDWKQRQRWIFDRKIDEPRLTADYPDIDTAPVRALRSLTDRFSAVFDIPYHGVWVNLYRDQRDSTSWHGDAVTCKRKNCTVPVLTLGHPAASSSNPTTVAPAHDSSRPAETSSSCAAAARATGATPSPNKPRPPDRASASTSRARSR